MTALTHQITSRTLVAAAFIAAALTQWPGRPGSLGQPASPRSGLPAARLPGCYR